LGVHAKDALPELKQALSDSSPSVRGYAARALGQLGVHAQDALPELKEALSDSSPSVRGYAARALGQLGVHAQDALPELKKALSDSDARVRVNAARALDLIEKQTKTSSLSGKGSLGLCEAIRLTLEKHQSLVGSG